MQTLEQLKTGQLVGIKQLKLAEGLTEFPMEILELADTLEVLDLSGNALSELPQELEKLTKLKIILLRTTYSRTYQRCWESFKPRDGWV